MHAILEATPVASKRGGGGGEKKYRLAYLLAESIITHLLGEKKKDR